MIGALLRRLRRFFRPPGSPVVIQSVRGLSAPRHPQN
ncbi:hypothetical protein amb1503 [Paramagnetospirillum magneticum AMB-1]|uniref:Uncharacterized protein n=1 Tax=Paramagnetospirillum magneticum (strain ATCC 700264 / AMB-1) TaxID=342108 RepID=Q2W768_PARM1|nr:hypothetical protein amb1503 [Paramagnetospirillum magneticum AMB-1]